MGTRILNPFLAAVIVVGFLSLACRKTPANDGNGYTGLPLIILDTDIGSSTDDLFALQMLYHYVNEGKCKLLGVVVDRMGEECAAMADVMNVYFDHPEVPIGLGHGHFPPGQSHYDLHREPGRLPQVSVARFGRMERRNTWKNPELCPFLPIAHW